jgi:ABC-type antimicrobial peptide transport system permease subunit
VVGGIVGIIKLGLAIMALWGLVAYAVERRTPEMGIRLALGATPSSLARLTMRPGAILILIGVPIGTIVGAGGAKIVQSMSVGLAPLDFIAMIPVSAAFTMVALVAAWWPARRAGRADVVTSLRRD